MIGAVTGDVLYGLIYVLYYPDGQYQIQILGRPILFRSRDGPGQYLPGLWTAAQLNPGLSKVPGHGREKVPGYFFIDQHGLHGVTNPGPLNLGIVAYSSGYFDVRTLIHKYVAAALLVF